MARSRNGVVVNVFNYGNIHIYQGAGASNAYASDDGTIRHQGSHDDSLVCYQGGHLANNHLSECNNHYPTAITPSRPRIYSMGGNIDYAVANVPSRTAILPSNPCNYASCKAPIIIPPRKLDYLLGMLESGLGQPATISVHNRRQHAVQLYIAKDTDEQVISRKECSLTISTSGAQLDSASDYRFANAMPDQKPVLEPGCKHDFIITGKMVQVSAHCFLTNVPLVKHQVVARWHTLCV